MTRSMPDYFLALMKQHGNLRSADEAHRVAQAISDALESTLDQKSALQVFTLMPKYLQPQGQKFYARLFDWQPKYTHSTLMERVELSLNLTDQTEVQFYLRAYFSAVKTLLDPATQRKLALVLPSGLTEIYSQS